MRALVFVALLACNSHDTGNAPGMSSSEDGNPVTLRLTPSSVELEHKAGKHTFQLESEKPTPGLVKPIIDEIFANGGKGGVTIWGRYDAPDVWNALAPALYDVPTRICLRNGDNC
ncbi:MAG: hypothetical protein ABI591_12125 [Kofleriaceae bacterium]